MRGALQRLSALAVGPRFPLTVMPAEGVAQRAMSSAAPDVEAEVLGLVNKDLLRTQAYVNGEWIDAADGKTLEVGRVQGSLAATATPRVPVALGCRPCWRRCCRLLCRPLVPPLPPTSKALRSLATAGDGPTACACHLH